MYSTPKATPAPNAKPKRPLTLAQVSRFCSPPSKNHGYQFLYFISHGCERTSHIRSGHNILGLSHSRILDIHYPTNNILSFLVHSDYASTVIDAVANLPAPKLITDFDPYSPTILRDPKYPNNTDPLFLKSVAFRIHQARLIRIVKRLPIQHLQLAVARGFCLQHK